MAEGSDRFLDALRAQGQLCDDCIYPLAGFSRRQGANQLGRQLEALGAVSRDKATCFNGRDGESYARYVEHVHDKIDESKQHFRQCDFALESLPQVLGREGYTTLVQLFGDYYWVKLTRGVRLRGRDEVADWLSWVAAVD